MLQERRSDLHAVIQERLFSFIHHTASRQVDWCTWLDDIYGVWVYAGGCKCLERSHVNGRGPTLSMRT